MVSYERSRGKTRAKIRHFSARVFFENIPKSEISKFLIFLIFPGPRESKIGQGSLFPGPRESKIGKDPFIFRVDSKKIVSRTINSNS